MSPALHVKHFLENEISVYDYTSKVDFSRGNSQNSAAASSGEWEMLQYFNIVPD